MTDSHTPDGNPSTERDAAQHQTDAERDIARRATAPDRVKGHGDGLLDTLGRSVSNAIIGSLPDPAAPADGAEGEPPIPAQPATKR